MSSLHMFLLSILTQAASIVASRLLLPTVAAKRAANATPYVVGDVRRVLPGANKQFHH